jgi:hypothetical protein
MRPISALIIAVTLVAGLVGGGAPAYAAPGPPTVQSCAGHLWNDLDSRNGNFFDSGGVNIRTGPHRGCASLGQGQLSHWVDYRCWTHGDTVARSDTGETWFTWTRLYDASTGVQGWVSDAYLDSNDGTRGSNVQCPGTLAVNAASKPGPVR